MGPQGLTPQKTTLHKTKLMLITETGARILYLNMLRGSQYVQHGFSDVLSVQMCVINAVNRN
jgi:hypothetical protein